MVLTEIDMVCFSLYGLKCTTNLTKNCDEEKTKNVINVTIIDVDFESNFTAFLKFLLFFFMLLKVKNICLKPYPQPSLVVNFNYISPFQVYTHTFVYSLQPYKYLFYYKSLHSKFSSSFYLIFHKAFKYLFRFSLYKTITCF